MAQGRSVAAHVAHGLVEVPYHLMYARAFAGTTNNVVKTSIEASASTSSGRTGVLLAPSLVLPLIRYGCDDIRGRALCTWLKGCSPVGPTVAPRLAFKRRSSTCYKPESHKRRSSTCHKPGSRSSPQ